jgi:hypothetical protein
MMLKSLNNLHVAKVALSLSSLAARAEILSFLLPRAKVLQTRALIDRKGIAVVCKLFSLCGNSQSPRVFFLMEISSSGIVCIALLTNSIICYEKVKILW